jgi:hypothetical protein
MKKLVDEKLLAKEAQWWNGIKKTLKQNKAAFCSK